MRIRCFTGLAASLLLAACGEPSQAPGATSAGVAAQALTSGPDFVVTAVTGPAAAMPGQALTVSVRTCNQGTQGAGSPVELYLSSDNVITPNTPSTPSPDLFVTGSYTYLGAGECQTQELSVNAYVPNEGIWYFGAAVDPMNNVAETNEGNNLKLGNRIGIGNKPDLVISSLSAPLTARPGDPVTFTVAVCNQGTQPGSGPVELFLSQDAVITPRGPTSDIPVGYVNLAPLAAGQCRTQQVQAMGGGFSDGIWYPGAVADADNYLPELFEDNNSRTGSRIGVGNKPELVVTAVSGPASARPGDPLTLSATVCNQGTQSAPSAVEWFLSTDNVLSPATDMPVGYDPGVTLAPGQCVTRTVQGNAGLNGAVYVAAIADRFNSFPEFFEDNNGRVGGRIGIGLGPDFVVSSVSGPTSALSGAPLGVTVRVCNQGTQGGSTDVELYLSKDAVITPTTMPGPNTDTPLAMGWTDYLAAGACRNLALNAPANATDGTYYLGAAADPHNLTAELIDDNNTRAGNRLGVGNKADFVVTALSGPASVTGSQSFTVSATVCNQGTAANSAEVEVVLSQDSTITPNGPAPGGNADPRIGGAFTSQLVPGACQTLSINAYGAAPQGTYYLGAAADSMNGVSELFEDNNTRTGSRIGVGYLPDFTVSSVTAPASALPYQSFQATVRVCNTGTQAQSPGMAEIYASADTVFTPPAPAAPTPDLLVASAPVGTVAPGQCLNVPLTVSNLQEGAWYLIGVTDVFNYAVEFIEDNNTRVGPRIGVGMKPDFVVNNVFASVSTVQMGQPFTASALVCNQGTVSGSTDVELYLTEDTVLTPYQYSTPSPDFLLGSVPVANLATGECRTVSLNAYAGGATVGTYKLGAIVSRYAPAYDELISDNNTRVAGTLTLVP